MGFIDRRDAGKQLGKQLQQYRGEAVVFALPRGGVETGVEVARALDAPLTLSISRKVGHPSDPEYAVAAVTEKGPLVGNERELVNMSETWLDQAVARERAEAGRRQQIYLDKRRPVSVEGKVAVVVDDGIATGLTMLSSVVEIRKLKPEKLVVAVPAAPREAVQALEELADEVVVLEDPDEYLGAVGLYYDFFPQLSDDEVIALLDEAETA